MFEFVNATLKRNYPSGYVLMVVNQNGISTSRLGWIDQKYSLDWSTAQVLEISDTLLELRMPTMTYKGVAYQNNKIGIHTARSPIGKPYVLPVDIGAPDLFVTEVLDRWDSGYFMALGLVPRQSIEK